MSKCAFEQLKLAFQTTPILRTSDWNKPFKIYCDAFEEAVGNTLCNWTKVYMTIPFILLADN
jgi:hypothetical protein